MTQKFLLPLLASCVFLSACAAQTSQPKTTPVVAPPVALEPVTTQPLPDLAARVSTLETNVAGLQTDMQAAKPKLEKVDAIDRKFRELSFELNAIDQRQTMTQAQNSAPVMRDAVKTEPVKKEAAPKMAATADVKKPEVKRTEAKKADVKKTSGPLQVQQLRIGAQADKTRLVLDTSAPARISYDLDNAEKILIVTIPKAQWGTAVKGAATSNPLIAAWQANKADDSVQLVLQLKQPVKILGSNQLAATSTASDRVYLDLAAEK